MTTRTPIGVRAGIRSLLAWPRTLGALGAAVVGAWWDGRRTP